jgi:hypothetical protein
MIISIDPGSSGGIIMIPGSPTKASPFSEMDLYCKIMPGSESEIFEVLQSFKVMTQKTVTVFIEQIPKWTGAKRFSKQTVYGASIATLYGNMKLCQGIAMGLGCVVRPLTPQKWQNTVGCTNPERLEKTPWKNKLKAHAQALFPQTTVTLWKADALLIAAAGIKLGLVAP